MIKKLAKRVPLAFNVLRTGQSARKMTRQIPPITPEEIEELKQFFPMDKFFIFGHARSGTTLLVRLLRLHPEVHCNYQAHFFTRPPFLSDMAADKKIGDWLARRSNRWNQGRDLTPVALRAMSDFIMEREARQLGKTIVGDKSPNSKFGGKAVREMHNLYPEARFVYIVRDGRDALVSSRFHSFVDQRHHLTDNAQKILEDYEKDPEPFYRGERSIFTEYAIRTWSEAWHENVVASDRLGRELYGERYHPLRYEDLIENTFETIAKLWRFLGADPTGMEQAVAGEMSINPDADWLQKKAKELSVNVVKGQRGSWRDLFTERDRRVFKDIAGETLIAWGYEKDLDW